MRRRTAQPKPEIIGAILGKVLKKRNIPHTSTNRRILDLWTEAVGPQISARTLPESLKRGTLYVRVSSSVWLHQLQFLKEEILDKLNALSGKDGIRTLHLSIGDIPAPAAQMAHPSSAPPSLAPLGKRDREMMQESLAAVTDPELREILERVMFREISRRREREMRKDR